MLRRVAVAWLVLGSSAGLAVGAYVGVIAGGGGPYQTEEWLISYAGGFVRRGFFGSLYLVLFPPGQAGLWVLFWVQLALYLIPVLFALLWLARNDHDWRGIALVCGPAAFAFVGWSVEAYARKESLAFTSLTLLALAVWASDRPRTRRALALVALVLFLVGVLSWEGNALVVPGVVFLILRAFGGWRSSREGRLHAALAASIAVVGLLLSVAFPGTTANADAICAAIVAKGLGRDLCGGPLGGALGYVGRTAPEMMAGVAQSFPVYWGYLPMAVLALLPLATTRWTRRHLPLALLSALAISPLFVVATDYGRWIALLVVELVICLMATARHPDGGVTWGGSATTLYLTLWGMPHWTSAWGEPAWPWLGAAKEAIDVVIRHGPGG